MTLAALIFLALAMSTDAFAAALGKGAAMRQPRFSQALRIGLLFGCIEAITPIIGWALGSLASKWIAQWDHWLAFFLLLALGGHMIWAGVHGDEEEESEDPARQNVFALALTAVATSIDAMAIGVGLAFVNVNIVHAALAIGVATTVMVTIGVMLGRLLGARIGKKAELIGGVILILVGATILYQHLHDEAETARGAAPPSAGVVRYPPRIESSNMARLNIPSRNIA
jgi:putative Mn2+ efflux pump MntP